MSGAERLTDADLMAMRRVYDRTVDRPLSGASRSASPQDICAMIVELQGYRAGDDGDVEAVKATEPAPDAPQRP